MHFYTYILGSASPEMTFRGAAFQHPNYSPEESGLSAQGPITATSCPDTGLWRSLLLSGNLGHGATLHYTRLDTIGTLFPYSLLDDRGVHYLPVVGAQNGDCTHKIYNQIIHTTSLRPDHQCSPEEGERSEPRRATNSYCPLVRCWTCDSVRTSTPSTKGLVLPSANLPVPAS